MKLKDPRITVQNTDGDRWQLKAEGLVLGEHDLETIEFTVLLPRSESSLPALTQQGIQRAIFLLQQHLEAAAAQD